MARKLRFFGVDTLDAPLQPDSFYVVENGDFAETYVTDRNGVPKEVGNSTMINQLITNSGSVLTPEIILGEIPTGLINGSNATYTTLFDFVPSKVAVYVNGLLQKKITHYNTSGTTTILFVDSPLTGDIIEVDYIKQ